MQYDTSLCPIGCQANSIFIYPLLLSLEHYSLIT
jgi:hypothetical protein